MRYSVKLLSDELSMLEHSLEKSIISYKRDSISLEVHQIHLDNLLPKIKDLKIALHDLLPTNQMP